MRVGRKSSLEQVAMAVGVALGKGGIRAVLTGGACAALYSEGAYSSVDADFVLIGEVDRSELDEVMGAIGFRRKGDRYVHEESAYFVEFLPGPLAIGGDDAIRPTTRRTAGTAVLLLSPTDSCRDRLAAYFHWNDRQSLAVAVAIAARHRIRWSVLRRWSDSEGFADKYEEFVRQARIAKATAPRRSPR